ncbi:MAG: hypothetical protein JSS21_10905 [Proteobacteria bacterium]|nr:hypothetical protein [Pseudomonadota bacterium]
MCLLLAVGAGNACAATIPACPEVSATATRAGLHDFDFLLGHWNVHNRRLKQRLADSHDWVEFAAKDSFAELPGGLGTEEHYSTDFWKGYAALGLHLYDPQHRAWTLYWADNRNAPGTLQTLAKGAFVDGVGVFCAPDRFNGKPITVRILWQRIDARHARWEQAFSTDRGASWETNWTMDFTRP